MTIVTLVNSNLRVELDPEAGAICKSIQWQVADNCIEVLRIARGREDDYLDELPLFGLFPMVPFVNRLDPATLLEGRARFSNTWPKENCAIHGTGWNSSWTVLQQTLSGVVLEHDARDETEVYRCNAQMRIQVVRDELTFELSLRNDSDIPIPVGFGLHPWFPASHDTQVYFGATHQVSLLGAEAQVMPFRGSLQLSASNLVDDCFLGWDGFARLVYPSNGRAVDIHASETLRALHIFWHPEWMTICVEPVSQGPNAAHRKIIERLAPMHVLEPKQHINGSVKFRLSLSPAVQPG